MFCCISSIQAILVPHNEPNWVADRASIMSRQAYLDFVTRSIVQLAAGIVDLMPKHFNMQFEADALVHFITMQEPGTRTRVCPTPWYDGPAATINSGRDRIDLVNKCDSNNKLYETGVPDNESTSPYSVGFCVLMVG